MIEARFKGKLLTSGQQMTNKPVDVELFYDDENDPLTVQMVLTVVDEDEVCWVVSRELLLRGVASLTPLGDGDVRVRGEAALDTVIVCLRSPQGHADIWYPHGRVVSFLNRTMDACRFGGTAEEETVAGHLDAFLAELFETEEDAA